MDDLEKYVERAMKVIVFAVVMVAIIFGLVMFGIGAKCNVSDQPLPAEALTVPASRPATHQTTILRVIDGDTIVVNHPLVGDVWLMDAKVRIRGIDCPELPTPEGLAAKAYTEQWLADHTTDLTVNIGFQRDKYGRLLGDVYSTDGVLSGRLLESGHATRLK